VRSYKTDVRKQALAAITRIVKAEALAGGALKEPLIEHPEGTDSVYNDPALAQRLRAPLEAALGKENVITTEPIAPSEDYSYFIQAGVPSLYFSLGGADPQKFAETKGAEGALPSNHSPFFAPDVDSALRAGIKAEVAVLRKLLNEAGPPR
jgi:hippurate hydrolase